MLARAKALAVELSLAFGASLCVGTALSSGSFSYGHDTGLIAQAVVAGFVWLPAALVAVWIGVWGMARAGPALGLAWDRRDSHRVLRPLLIGALCLAQPLIGYAAVGPALLALALLACIWRWWTAVSGGRRLTDLADKLEEKLGRIGDGRVALAVFALATLFYLTVVSGLYAPLPQPEGDEPHYLTASYSLLADGDLNLFNNYTRGDYKLWHRGWIQAHTKEGKEGMKQQFSMHGVGLAVYQLPFLAATAWTGDAGLIHFSVRLGMVLIAGGLLSMLYLALAGFFGTRRAALGIVLLAGTTVPILFFSYHLFTETAAALLCLFALSVLWRDKRPGWAQRLLAGTALGLLPWLGAKYLALAAPFAVLWLVRELRWGWSWKKASATAIPGAVLGALFLWHVFSMFGTWNPTAFYVGARGSILGQTAVLKVSHAADPLEAAAIAGKTGLSYWVDQKEGLLAFAPWYLLGLAGWIGMACSRDWRRLAFWLLALIAPFYLVYCLTGFGGGHSPPARSMTAILWAVLIPAAWMIRKAFARARELTLALITLSLIVSAALLANPAYLYHDFHVRASHLLTRVSTPFLDATYLFPSVNNKHFENWEVAALWLAALAAAVALLLWRRSSAGRVNARWPGAGILALAIIVVGWAMAARTPPLHEKPFEAPGAGLTVWFERGTAYIDANAFWVRTGGKEWCYVVSRKPVKSIELGLRTIVPNIIRVSGAEGTQVVRLADKKRTKRLIRLRGGFGTEKMWVRRFSIESLRGVPENSGRLKNDSRALGVEVKILSASIRSE